MVVGRRRQISKLLVRIGPLGDDAKIQLLDIPALTVSRSVVRTAT